MFICSFTKCFEHFHDHYHELFIKWVAYLHLVLLLGFSFIPSFGTYSSVALFFVFGRLVTLPDLGLVKPYVEDVLWCPAPTALSSPDLCALESALWVDFRGPSFVVG